MNRDVRGVFTCLIVFLCFIASATAGAASRWDNPLPQGNILADVAWNGRTGIASRYVAIGNGGTILESADGLQWNGIASGTKTWLQAIRWTGSQFIVVGNNGTILTSPDGAQWTRQASRSTSYLYGVDFNSGTLVVVGSSGTVLTSPDGVTWTTRNVGVGVHDWLNDVAWSGQAFVAVGENGSIFGSTDGITWERRLSPVRTENADGTASGPSLEGIAWSPELGLWVVVSEQAPGTSSAYVLTSPDGSTWTGRLVNSRALHAVVWNATEARFVAAGSYGRLLTSADATTWNPVDTGLLESLESVTFGPAGYVTVGEHGIALHATDPSGTWARASTSPLANLSAAAFLNGGYVAVGNGIILRSADATLGQPLTAVMQAEAQNLPALNGVAAGPGGYVAVGRRGAILHSPDGSSWTFDASSGSDLNDLKDVVSTTLGWFAVGNNGTVRRDAGQGWTTVRAGDETLTAIAADTNGLIAVGARTTTGVLLTSIEGTTWIERGVPGVTYQGVATGNGRRVAVGSGGTYSTFADGAWVDGNMGTVYTMNHVTWDGHRFIAVGDQGMTFTSGDGMHWAQQTITGNSLTGVAASGNGFLVVGEGGTIVFNSCPCAADDLTSTPVNVAVTIAVLANDTGDGLLIRSHDARSTRGGTVVLHADGTLTYTPGADFSGTDVFSYTLGSSLDPDAADTANVTVIVGSSGGGGGGTDPGGTGTTGGTSTGGTATGSTGGSTDSGTGTTTDGGTTGGTDTGTGGTSDGGSSAGTSRPRSSGGGGNAASLLGLLLLVAGRRWRRLARA